MKINCNVAKDLIKRLMQNDIEKRLGHTKGFDQILEHEYFNCPEFCDYKDIYEGCFEIDKKD